MKRLCSVRVPNQEDRYDFRPTPDLELSHQEFHIPLYCVEAQAEGEGDLFIAEPPNQQAHNLLFPAVEIEMPGCL